MDEEKKAIYYLKQLYNTWPKGFVEKIDVRSRGIWIILHYISKTSDEVCAGDISKAFNVSTARTTAALKTLVKKGYVETSVSTVDRRKVVVKITDKGRTVINKCENEQIEFMKCIIDKIGEDDLQEFLRIFAKINSLIVCKE